MNSKYGTGNQSTDQEGFKNKMMFVNERQQLFIRSSVNNSRQLMSILNETEEHDCIKPIQ